MLTIEEYIEQHSSKENAVLAKINRMTHLNVLNPHMLSGQVQGRFLSLISQMIHPCHILELGTYTGYSALCLAEGLDTDGRVVTLEKNDELEETIRQNLAMSPLGKQIELHIGDCKEIIPTLHDSFDLVFIDADKREYSTYLDLVFDNAYSSSQMLWK